MSAKALVQIACGVLQVSARGRWFSDNCSGGVDFFCPSGRVRASEGAGDRAIMHEQTEAGATLAGRLRHSIHF
jgi:hypothetical protein